MIEDENYKRYKELQERESAGIMTAEEYDEMFQLEQNSLQEDCMRMAQMGV